MPTTEQSFKNQTIIKLEKDGRAMTLKILTLWSFIFYRLDILNTLVKTSHIFQDKFKHLY